MMTCIQPNLYDKLRHVQGNQYELCKVKMCTDYESDNLPELILHEKKDGLFVTTLSNKDGNMSHAVGLDIGEK